MGIRINDGIRVDIDPLEYLNIARNAIVAASSTLNLWQALIN